MTHRCLRAANLKSAPGGLAKANRLAQSTKLCQIIALEALAVSLRSFSISDPLFSATSSLFLQNMGGGGYAPARVLEWLPRGKSPTRRGYGLRRNGILNGGDARVFREQVLAVLDD